MTKGYLKVVKTLTLTLNEEEAHWLKGYLQNDAYHMTTEESNKDAKMRKSIFEALHHPEEDI